MALYFLSGAILIFGALILNAAFSGSKEIITFPFSSTGYSSNGEEFFGGFSSSSGSGYGTLHHDDIYAKETFYTYDARGKGTGVGQIFQIQPMAGGQKTLKIGNVISGFLIRSRVSRMSYSAAETTVTTETAERSTATRSFTLPRAGTRLRTLTTRHWNLHTRGI